MDKLLFNKLGFSVVETIMVLIVVSCLMVVLPFTKPLKSSTKQSQAMISSTLDQAKLKAINCRCKVYLDFNDDYIQVDNNKIKINNIDFEKNEIYFNQKGNNSQAKSIYFKQNNQRFRIVFMLGSGSYEIRNE